MGNVFCLHSSKTATKSTKRLNRLQKSHRRGRGGRTGNGRSKASSGQPKPRISVHLRASSVDLRVMSVKNACGSPQRICRQAGGMQHRNDDPCSSWLPLLLPVEAQRDSGGSPARPRGSALRFRFALAQSFGGIEPGRALQNLIADRVGILRDLRDRGIGEIGRAVFFAHRPENSQPFLWKGKSGSAFVGREISSWAPFFSGAPAAVLRVSFRNVNGKVSYIKTERRKV